MKQMDCSRRSGKQHTGHRPLRAKKKNPTQTFSLSHSVRPVIVVSHKWVEGPKLHPSYTQLLGGVAFEATDVSPNKGHPEQAELQHR